MYVFPPFVKMMTLKENNKLLVLFFQNVSERVISLSVGYLDSFLSLSLASWDELLLICYN